MRARQLSAAVRRGLAPLRGRDREIVLRAAAVGQRFDVALLAELTQSSPRRVVAALRAAVRVQLLVRVREKRGCFEFRHALTRDAVYGELIVEQLRPVHRAIAAALERLHPERPAELDELAFHWWAAGDRVRGARYNEAAGDRAAAVHAADQALLSYRRALELVPGESPERQRLAAKIAAVGRADAVDG